MNERWEAEESRVEVSLVGDGTRESRVFIMPLGARVVPEASK